MVTTVENEGKTLVAVSYKIRFEVMVDPDTGMVERVEGCGLMWDSDGMGEEILPDGSYGEHVQVSRFAQASSRCRAHEEADRFHELVGGSPRDQVRRIIELLEAAADGFTRENGGHPSEYNTLTSAEINLRKMIEEE